MVKTSNSSLQSIRADSKQNNVDKNERKRRRKQRKVLYKENKQNFRYYYTMFKLTFAFVFTAFTTICMTLFAYFSGSVAAAVCIDMFVNSFLLLLSFKFTDFIYRKCCFSCIALQASILGTSFVIQQKLDNVSCVIVCLNCCFECKEFYPNGICCQYCPCCNHSDLTDAKGIENARLAHQRHILGAKNARMHRQKTGSSQNDGNSAPRMISTSNFSNFVSSVQFTKGSVDAFGTLSFLFVVFLLFGCFLCMFVCFF